MGSASFLLFWNSFPIQIAVSDKHTQNQSHLDTGGIGEISFRGGGDQGIDPNRNHGDPGRICDAGTELPEEDIENDLSVDQQSEKTELSVNVGPEYVGDIVVFFSSHANYVRDFINFINLGIMPSGKMGGKGSQTGAQREEIHKNFKANNMKDNSWHWKGKI